MKKITAADLLRLDFKQVDVSKDDGWDEGYFEIAKARIAKAQYNKPFQWMQKDAPLN